MLAPPTDLTEASLAATLARGWGIEVAGLEYRAVGFGSHHWEVVEAGGARWFVTVDELCSPPDVPSRRRTRRSRPGWRPPSAPRGRCGTWSTAFDFIVAPVPSLDGAVLLPAGEGFAAAVYPLLEGESFRWGPFRYDDQLAAVVAMLISLHGAALGRAAGAPVEEFRVQRRDELELAFGGGRPRPRTAVPFSLPLAELISRNVPAVRAALHNYDELVANVAPSTPRVLTHGEPHAGNTMLTIDGWKLIDWDTAAFAPPERDLWNLDPGDGSVLSMYADATGHLPRRALLELYRLRSDLDDIALCAADLRTDHVEDANTAMSWETVQGIVQSLSASVERA